MIDRIKELVEFAHENVPLYRKLYVKKPEIRDMGDFRRLPCLMRNSIALCKIEEFLADVDEASIILPPIENKLIFPFPRLESAEDRDIRYEIFYFLLSQVGVMDGSSFLIIADTKHSYYFGEIASNLLYFGHPTWMMLLRDHTDEEVRLWLEKFQPDHLMLGLDRIPENVTEWGISSIFTVNNYDCDLSSTDEMQHFDIYAIAELGWIAVRLPGGYYMYPREFFIIESEPAGGILTITALESWLQPFIRYRTADRGKILAEGKLEVSYIGEH